MAARRTRPTKPRRVAPRPAGPVSYVKAAAEFAESKQPEHWEPTLLQTASKGLRGMDRAMTVPLSVLGLLWIGLGVVLASAVLPVPPGLLVGATVASSFLVVMFGLWVLYWGVHMSVRLERNAEKLDTLATMDNRQRHRTVARHLRHR